MKKRYFIFIVFIILSFQFSCKEQSSEDDNNNGNLTVKTFFGYVFSANDFSPLNDVKIEETQTGTNSFTNTQGYFEFQVESIDCNYYKLKFSKENLEDEYISVKDNGNSRQKVDVFIIPKLNGNVYYVAPSGDNSNPGNESEPWKSPGFASRKLNPGDTLIIKKGEYIVKTFDLDIIHPTKGNSNNWILIKGEEGVKIKGENNIITLIDLSNSSFIKLENLEITNNNKRYVRDGIEVLGGNIRNILLKNVYIHHIDEFGVNIRDVDYMVLEYSQIRYCGFGGLGGPSGNYGGIRNLKVLFSALSYSGHYYQGGNGSSRPYDRPDGFGIERSRGPIEIYDSVFEHNYGDGVDSKASNTYIHNCIIANNSCDGVKLWHGQSKIKNTLIYGTGDGVGGDSPWAGIVIDCDREEDKFEIVNVTLNDNKKRRAYPMYVQYDNNYRIDVIIKNSIFSGGFGHLWFRKNVKLTMEYNIIYIPSRDDQIYANGRLYSEQDIKNGVLGEGNIFGDPGFVNPAWGTTGNYHLKSGSPAIDKIDKKYGPSDDLEHTKRPQGEKSDIGAYEKK